MFELLCHGEAFVTKKLVVFKGKINQDYEDVCREKTVRIAWNYDFGIWDENGAYINITSPWNENLEYGWLNQIEYFVPFINSLGLQVQWKYTDEVKGGFNKTSKLFEGAMGEVSALVFSKT